MNELSAAAKSGDQAKLNEIMNPIVEHCAKMIQGGVLRKNVVAHLVNRKIGQAAAENIVECATIRAENWMARKAK